MDLAVSLSNSTLTVLRGPAAGREFPLHGDELTLGRSLHCDIAIRGSNISRLHLKLFREPDGQWIIIDLNTKNGTTVNSKKVDRHRLSDNDEVEIGGDAVLLFQHDGTIDTAVRTLSIEDVASYAAELDATLKLPNFLGWLRKNQYQIESMNPDELEKIARECLYEFAHLPEPREAMFESELQTQRRFVR